MLDKSLCIINAHTLAAHGSAIIREHIKIPIKNALADKLNRNDCSLFQL